MNSLVVELHRLLSAKESELIGCPRKNRWNQNHVWRNLRGNALLAVLGMKIRARSPVGEFDVFVRREHDGFTVLMFRGGKPKPWWEDDARLLLALCRLYVNIGTQRVAIISELDSELHEQYVESEAVSEEVVQKALNWWRDFARIPKNSPRAFVLCPWCPVKARCDAEDVRTGQTADWPADYKVG